MALRVAVTGIGLVTALGNDPEEFARALLDGQSAGGPITLFDPASLLTRIAAEVPLRVEGDRKSFFAAQAARAALSDAGLKKGGGLSLGIGLDLFSMPAMVDYLHRRPHDRLQTPAEECLQALCAEHQLDFPPRTHVSA